MAVIITVGHVFDFDFFKLQFPYFGNLKIKEHSVVLFYFYFKFNFNLIINYKFQKSKNLQSWFSFQNPQ